MSNNWSKKRNVFERPKMYYDIEVFKHDWMICFEDEDGNKVHIHNGDLVKLNEYVRKYTLVGFNNHHYDDKIVAKISESGSKCTKFGDPSIIKGWNDKIIVDKEFWWTPFSMHTLDLRSVVPKDMSLKKLESHNGWNIHETSVDFNIQRELTPEELDSSLEYCYYDVKRTKDLFKGKEADFMLKEFLYDQICETKPMGYTRTNVSMINDMFGGFEKTDERILPRKDLFEKLPVEVQEFFRDGKMTATKKDEKLQTITVETKTAVYDFSGGGGHGINKSNQRYFKNVVLVDGNSLYPSIMILFNMFGTELTALLQSFLDERFARKQVGDKSEVIYKLLVNSLYGILGAKWYDKEGGVYCPALRESVCLIGQTLLYDLTLRYEEVGAEVININTDGIAFVGDHIDDETIARINGEFTKDWGIDLSIDKFTELWQKDVNNYIGIEPDGKIKVKGAYVTRYPNIDIKRNGGIFYSNTSNTIIDYMVVDTLTGGDYDTIYKDFIEPYLKADNQLNAWRGVTGIKKTQRDKYRVEKEICQEMLHNYVKYNQLDKFKAVFDELGIFPFARTIYTTKAYPRIDVVTGDADNTVVETLQKVNRVYASTNGVSIKKFTPIKEITSKKTGITNTLYDVHDKISGLSPISTIINTDLDSLEIDFDTIDIDFYVEHIVNRIIGYHSSKEVDEDLFN